MPRLRVRRLLDESSSPLGDAPTDDLEVVVPDDVEVVVPDDASSSSVAVVVVRTAGRALGASGTVSGRLGWTVARIVGRSAWKLTRAAAVGARRRPQVAMAVVAGAVVVVGVIVIVRSTRPTESEEAPERPLRSVA